VKVLVIGGGIVGTGIALELAKAKVEVTVVERGLPGAEASSAAGGMLAPQLENTAPGPALDFGLRSRAAWPAWAKDVEERSGVPVGYLPSGVVLAAFTENDAHGLEATVAWQTASSLRATFLTGDEARALEPGLSPKALAGAHFPDDHQVDNQALMRALPLAATRAGVTFRTATVRAVLEQSGRATGVDADGEQLFADAVVLAAGAWSSLVPGTRLPPNAVRPVRGQMAELTTRSSPLEHIVKTPAGYLVPRADGRVIAGSTMEYVGFDKRVTAEGLAKLLSMAGEVCPALGQATVSASWAGLRPGTEDKLPFLGPGPLERLYLATGHFRNGILLAPMTARVLAALVQGERPAVDLRPFRFERFST